VYRALHNLKSPGSIDVLVKGEFTSIQELTQSAGGTFKYAVLLAAKDSPAPARECIAAVRIPVAAINNFIERKDITRIESYKHRMTALNDTMRVRNNINEVQQGQSPLTQGYDGSGVVIGLIDAGIDFNHPDFKDSSDHSRVKWIWDMAMQD